MRFMAHCILLSLVLISSAQTDSSPWTGSSVVPLLSTDEDRTSCDNSEGLPPVGDQVVAGSCYAWAAAYYHLTHLQWQEFGWDVTDPEYQCSPAFVYNLTNGGVDNGAGEGDNARADAFEVLRTLGCATMADMPYSYTGYRTFPSEEAFRNGIRFRTLSTNTIGTENLDGLQELKEHLLAGYTAVLGIYGYQNLNNIGSYDNTYCVSQITGERLYWHEVCVVGFDDDRETADGLGAFRIVNSWSPYWGDDGFFWMSYEAVMDPRTSYQYALYAADRIGYAPAFVGRLEASHQDRYRLHYRFGLGSPESPELAFDFFDFHPMSNAAGVAYPEGAAMVLDLSDMAAMLNSAGPNEIFLQITDTDPGDGRSGTLHLLWLEDLMSGLYGMSGGMPEPIPDTNETVFANVQLDFAPSPPTDLVAVVDPGSGLVDLTWVQPSELTGFSHYRIYSNCEAVDSVDVTNCSYQLPQAGAYHFAVSAVHIVSESLQPKTSVIWANAFGLPFADDFETGLDGWYRAGASNFDPVIVDDPVHSGQFAAGLRTGSSEDDTSLGREFYPVEGIALETWFNMADLPSLEMGLGAGLAMADSTGIIVGTYVDGNASPCYMIISDEPTVGVLDSLATIELDRWYRFRLRYLSGILYAMLLTDAAEVLCNVVVETPDVQPVLAGIAAQGLNLGWNYFDDFAVRPWDGCEAEWFSPVSPTNESYALVVMEAFMDGASLSAGDEIGVFDGERCVGAGIVTGSWPLVLDARGSTGHNPGFAHGDSIRFELWLAQEDSVHSATALWEAGNGTFGDGLFSRLRLYGGILGVDDESDFPIIFALSPVSPNPLNGSTTLALSLGKEAFVSLRVYDLAGREVMRIADERFGSGYHTLPFAVGSLTNGVYAIRAVTDSGENAIRKVVILR